MKWIGIAGLAAILVLQGGSQAAVIRLKNRTIHTAREIQPREPIPADAYPGHWILQFRTFPGKDIRVELARRQIRVLAYVPDFGLLVSLEEPPDLAGLGVTWTGRLQAADKLSPLLDGARTYIAIFHSDVPPERARALLNGCQVLDAPDLLPNHFLLAADARRVRQLATHDELSYVLPGTPDLLIRRRLHRCPGPLTAAGPVGEYATMGSGWLKDGSGNVSIGYFFDTMTAKLGQNTVRSEVARAFSEWMRYANVTISSAQQQAAARSIDILFASGTHGDAYPFDGPGGVLAHTFYPAPLNPEPIAGDIHFDNAEDWNVGADIDLFSVALHEAGHALGLAHSQNADAVMYPYYRLSTGLTNDDIQAIQSLYGSPSTQPAQPTQPSRPTQPTQPFQPTQPSQPPGTDTVPPSLTILSPSSTIVAAQSATIVFSGVAKDNVGVTAVTWSNSTGGSGNVAGTASWTATIPLLVGTNIITVRAYDAAGNSGWRAVTVVRWN
jgi:hypothetical protein